MKAAVFGGTGFIGGYLTKALAERGHIPVLLVRPGSEKKITNPEKCVLVHGTVDDPNSIEKTLDGCQAAIYLIGIIRENPRKGVTFQRLHYEGLARVADSAVNMGIKRFILMSANGVKPDGTLYQRTKYLAEEYLKTTGLHWTIFRPSIIFGDPSGKPEFCTMVKRQIIMPYLPAPIFYKGIIPKNSYGFCFSPVHVKNVASVFAKSLEMEDAFYRTFNICGKVTVKWKELLRIVAKASGKKKFMLPIPVGVVMLAAKIFDRFGFFPVTRDQLTMLAEGNVCDSNDAFGFFGEEEIPFTVENLGYLRLCK